MMAWPHHAALILILLAIGGNLAGCDRPAARVQPAAGEAAQAQALPQVEPLYGGDTRAWLTPAGDAADRNYCAASLRLPLARDPAWVYEYGIEFSSSPPSTIVHHDGLLVVAADCSLLLGLEAATGQLVFNSDVYVHADAEGPEALNSIFFQPRGLLVGQDDLGRHYCWDLRDGGPRRRWLGEPAKTTSGFVVSDEAVICGRDLGTACLAITDGRQRWEYPVLTRGAGVVLGSDGTVVTWANGSEFYALRAGDGAPLWSYFSGVAGYGWAVRAVIEPAQECVYLVLPDERVQCRELTTGTLRWEHGWSDLLSPAARDELYAGTQYGQIPLHAAGATATPEGLVLSMAFGAVLALDHQGSRRWVYESDLPVLGAIGFDNAVLVSEYFLAPEFIGLVSWLRVYCPDTVDWERYRAADEERRRRGMFQRLAALDPATGEPLDYFEPRLPMRAVVPACDKIIFGEAPLSAEQPRRILAYDWIVAEGT